jgi:glycosyltransferase involved in cell wall biosynthesis
MHFDSASKRIKLIDSQETQRVLNIMMVTRDSERSLPATLAMFEELERAIECDFNYVFVENGSKDRTHELVVQFLKTRKGILHTPENADKFDNLVRPQRIANARNSGIKFLEPKAKWTLLVDNDIYFDVNALIALFQQNPTLNGYAKVCAFGELAIFNEQTYKLQPTGHYYDTWAFTLKQGETGYNIYWPHCVFEDCPICKRHLLGPKLKREGVIEVGSAFGGFAIVNTSGMINRGVSYFSALVSDSSVLERRITCEHVPFCMALSSKTGQKIVIAANSRVFYDGTKYVFD